MKKSTKIGIGAAAALTAGALAFAAPSFAGPALSSFQAHAEGSVSGPRDHGIDGTHIDGTHIEAELTASVTGVPTDVTDAHDAAHGGYWEAFELDATATSVPATKPTEGGFVVGIRPQHDESGTLVEPTIADGVLSGSLDFHLNETDTTKVFALYPSDGGTAVLVTVTVDADGVATANASGELSVTYSADVVAEGPAFGRGGHDEGRHGGRGHGHGDGMGGFEDEDGFTPTDPATTEVTPNA